MTVSFQTSSFAPFSNTNNRRGRRNNIKTLNMYQVDIENFDNEIESYEVEAHSASEAAEIAASIFGCDIYNMNVYQYC